MAGTLTDWLSESRLTVVAVHAESGRIRVKGAAEVCSDLDCGTEAEVHADDVTGGLAALNPGDIVRIESPAGMPRRIVVVRRVWDEIGSPEF
ncbi:MAG: hypothetical protein HYU41_17370 [Candidatus Rokubacteria bacterium]|nr:hypothetical protein [Candidatus Rokubacteria bacterium]